MDNTTVHAYADRIYAGVLGKVLGVYVGRPVEGWTYADIRSRFGQIDYFVSDTLGVPLIVPDDDISGTLVFPRAILDRRRAEHPTAADIGDTWLNYIVENRTVLWWGGLARSTEHTAYLRLKEGITPPRSGSIQLNGRSMAEGIGAQIFIDGWALSSPNDPDQAASLARSAASVSHDGLAVEAAVLIATMEAAAFTEPDIDKLIATGLSYVTDERVRTLVTDTVDQCQSTTDWRTVRNWIEKNHGYARYPGNSPAATNLAAVLMALVMAHDDFQLSLGIIASAGWDTDSNAGNVGCLNGIRLGLKGIEAGADLRGPVADRLLVVSADGGECISDAVLETRKLVASAASLRGEPKPERMPRFAFERPGSMQGWRPHQTIGAGQALQAVTNTGDGLRLTYTHLAPGMRAAVAVETFASPTPTGAAGTSLFEVIGSPTLYSTQRIRATIDIPPGPVPHFRFFVEHYGDEGTLNTTVGLPMSLTHGENAVTWQVPDTNGEAIYRLGIELTSTTRVDGHVTLRNLDWHGAPREFHLGRADELSPTLTPWTTQTGWLKTFVSSATNLAPDYTTTFTVSHPLDNGVVTTGTRDWDDYTVHSDITFNMHDAAGLVARARGHRRYYAAVLRPGRAQILLRYDGTETVLAEQPFTYEVDDQYTVDFEVSRSQLVLRIDQQEVVRAQDETLHSGAAGFLIDRGSVLASTFTVSATQRATPTRG